MSFGALAKAEKLFYSLMLSPLNVKMWTLGTQDIGSFVQTWDQGRLQGTACVRRNRIEGRVSVHSSTPLFLPKSKHTHNNNNNK